METRFEDKVRDLERRVIDRPGSLDPAIRRAVWRGDDVPRDAAPYVEKVRRHAFTITDRDVAALRDAGYSEDQVFEMTVAAAHGAAARMLASGLRALEEALARSGLPAEGEG